MGEHLIVFADALPFDSVRGAGEFSSFETVVPLHPTFGFSVNIHAELFSGSTADDVGFFNEWAFDPKGSNFSFLSPLSGMLDFFEGRRFLDYPARVLIKSLFSDFLEIPLGALPLFAKKGRSTTEPNFPKETIFDSGIQLILPKSREKGKRDEECFQSAMSKMKEGESIFVYLPDTDSAGHIHGPTSEDFRGHVSGLLDQVTRLSDTFREMNPKGTTTLISDHGMAPTKREVSIDFRGALGRNGKRVAYYLDSTMARFWILDSGAEAELARLLEENSDIGTSVSEDERKRYGITDRAFGDAIFLLKEGNVFCPNFVSLAMPSGMHGYHPELASQQGVFIHSAPVPAVEGGGIRSLQVHRFLKGLLKGKDGD